MVGKSYITRKLNKTAKKYKVDITDIISLYNCINENHRLAIWLILEHIHEEKENVDTQKLYEDIQKIPFFELIGYENKNDL